MGGNGSLSADQCPWNSRDSIGRWSMTAVDLDRLEGASVSVVLTRWRRIQLSVIIYPSTNETMSRSIRCLLPSHSRALSPRLRLRYGSG